MKEISLQWKIELPKIKNLMIHHVSEEDQIITGENFKIIKTGTNYLPLLSETKILEKFPNVMVDMGAVKFMCNGANVMRPGIKNYTDFEKGDIVCVVEESQNKFLAVGKSIVPSSEMKSMKKGEVLKNLHYISDKFWETGKTID